MITLLGPEISAELHGQVHDFVIPSSSNNPNSPNNPTAESENIHNSPSSQVTQVEREGEGVSQDESEDYVAGDVESGAGERGFSAAFYQGLYHEYVTEECYTPPDLAIAFNSG